MKWIKKNWDATLAFLFIWIAPLIMLLIQAVSFYKINRTFDWSFELAATFTLGIVLIIYFTKGRKWIDKKLLINEIKGGLKSPLLVLIDGFVTCATIGFIYLIVVLIQAFCSSVSSYLELILIFEIIGAIFNFVHALRMKGLEYEKDK